MIENMTSSSRYSLAHAELISPFEFLETEEAGVPPCGYPVGYLFGKRAEIQACLSSVQLVGVGKVQPTIFLLPTVS